MIAIKYKGGVIVSNDCSFDQMIDTSNKSFKNVININNPFVIGDAPNRGDECFTLTSGFKVNKCTLITEYTKNKIRLEIISDYKFDRREWQHYHNG